MQSVSVGERERHDADPGSSRDEWHRIPPTIPYREPASRGPDGRSRHLRSRIQSTTTGSPLLYASVNGSTALGDRTRQPPVGSLTAPDREPVTRPDGDAPHARRRRTRVRQPGHGYLDQPLQHHLRIEGTDHQARALRQKLQCLLGSRPRVEQQRAVHRQRALLTHREPAPLVLRARRCERRQSRNPRHQQGVPSNERQRDTSRHHIRNRSQIGPPSIPLGWRTEDDGGLAVCHHLGRRDRIRHSDSFMHPARLKGLEPGSSHQAHLQTIAVDSPTAKPTPHQDPPPPAQKWLWPPRTRSRRGSTPPQLRSSCRPIPPQRISNVQPPLERSTLERTVHGWGAVEPYAPRLLRTERRASLPCLRHVGVYRARPGKAPPEGRRNSIPGPVLGRARFADRCLTLGAPVHALAGTAGLRHLTHGHESCEGCGRGRRVYFGPLAGRTKSEEPAGLHTGRFFASMSALRKSSPFGVWSPERQTSHASVATRRVGAEYTHCRGADPPYVLRVLQSSRN